VSGKSCLFVAMCNITALSAFGENEDIVSINTHCRISLSEPFSFSYTELKIVSDAVFIYDNHIYT
jgi:hypothetical protein